VNQFDSLPNSEMTILDTNVLSEILKPLPIESVLLWLAEQEPATIFTTTITQAEILYGVELLPKGRRHTALVIAVEHIFADEFSGRILAFDESAARAYSRIGIARKLAGRPISQFDAMIAGIAHSHRATVATRNTADFEGCGIRVFNPWD
jgi:predicted nucleic acid-binding protein